MAVSVQMEPSMSYRDERDALQAKVDSLEGDLAAARAEAERLRAELDGPTLAHRTFSTVLGLSPAEQRALLREGDSPERLWAAWALALGMGADAIPLVKHGALLDGNEGVRRQLLVVAAGFGERPLLSTVAAHDPSPEVRLGVLRLLRSPLPEDAFRWVARSYALLSAGSPVSPARAYDVEQARWMALSLVRADLSPTAVKLLDAPTAAVLKAAFEAEAKDLAESDPEDFDEEDLAESLRLARGAIACLEAREGAP